MKKYFMIIFISLLPGTFISKCQQLISLESCYEKASINHPLAGGKEMHNKIWQLRQDNLSSSWYPEINTGANFLYNSSVTDLSGVFESIPLPGTNVEIPVMPHDQYKLTLDINQLIYDGGAIKGNRELEKAKLELNRKEVDVELYKIREQVNKYYFSFILLKKQKNLLYTYLNTINEQISSLESGIRNGVLLPSDRQIMKAEKIMLEQQLNETDIRISTTASILAGLTGMEISSDTEARLPEPVIDHSSGLGRPELFVLDLKRQEIDAGKSILKSQRKPKAFAFASLGYGRPPGNDFFSDSFGPFYIVGAGVKWKIIDWNKNHRQQQVIDLNMSLISSHKKTMEENINRALEMKYAEIRSLASTLESDRELIATLKTVSSTARSQYQNGTITASEYLAEWNKEKKAVINHEIHSVSLAKAKVEYLNIAGTDIK